MLKCAYKSLAAWALIFVLTIIRYNPSAYNIDSLNAQVFRDPMPGKRGSYFGFSVALYVGADESLLLVGAPRANSSELPYVMEPGTVFKCAMNGVCKEWVMDKTGNGPHPRERFINQIKDNAWIGATIAVQNKTEARVMVCGPRWINNIIHYNRPNWYMNGICYTTLARNANAFERQAEEHFLPLSNSKNQITSRNNIGIYKYGQSQVGFSLHMNSQNAINIAIGSPGVYNWKGDAILTVPINGSFSRTIIPSFARQPGVHSYNYFGYAITAGTYFNEQDVWYASSTPQVINIYGRVFVFNFPPKTNQRMFIKTIVYGQQYGEYFGAALTSCNVNNNRRDELIVGAPQWSRDMDEGRVYIFTARYRGSWNFVKPQTIEGEIVGGRFGSTVMCLGDIDHDGYGDIAVGVPYEEESGGAVYIFNGNRDGVSRKYSQRLVGSQFSPRIRGFGISISEPRDINRDNHLDIAVGAHQSGEVVLLKSMPVVTINVTFVSKNLPILKNMSFGIDIGLSYEGYSCLQVIIILKLDQTYRRARVIKDEWYSELSEPPQTITRTINLKENIQNMKNPFEISVSVQLKYCCFTSCVINIHRSKTEDIIKLPFINFKNNTSDLNVTLSTDSSPDNTYVIGCTSIIMLHIDIYNRGDRAYQTKVRIFIEILILASIPSDCIEVSHKDRTLNVICDVGDVPSKTKKRLTLQLDMSMIRYDVKNIKLQAFISTQSNEINLDDNTHVITVYFEDIALKITGKARESLYSYLYVNETRTPNSITFLHFYEIQNFGVSPVEEAVLTVKIPTHISQPDIERIAIVNIKRVTFDIGRMDGYKLYCVSHQAKDSSVLKKVIFTHRTIMKNSSKIANDNTHVKFSPSIRIPPENRTFYINCTSSAVYCTQFDCKLPFLNSSSVVKFLITLDLQLSNFPDDMMEDKDIIFYVTEGRIKIIQPSAAQRNGHKLNTLVATTFLGPLPDQRIPAWLIALSIFSGLILLTLLTLCLKNVGFFDRPDLRLLKAESDLCLKIVD